MEMESGGEFGVAFDRLASKPADQRAQRIVSRRFPSRRVLRRIACVVLSAAVVSVVWNTSLLAAVSAPESSIKAAFLYKFLAYVEWPADSFSSASDPIVIGVLRNEAVAQALREIAADDASPRPVIVYSLQEPEALEKLHVLFVGRSAEGSLERVVRLAHEHSILTVSETNRARAQQCVLDFVVVDGRVRFAASLSAANQAGVRLSSRLLAVAEAVDGEAKP